MNNGPTESFAGAELTAATFPAYHTSKLSSASTGYTDAAAGAGTIARGDTAEIGASADPAPLFTYVELLWRISVDTLRGLGAVLPMPPDLSAAESNPRYYSWTWETAPTLESWLFSVLARPTVHALADGSDKAAAVAHGYTLAYWPPLGWGGGHSPTLAGDSKWIIADWVDNANLPAGGFVIEPAAADYGTVIGTGGGYDTWEIDVPYRPDHTVGDGVAIPPSLWTDLTVHNVFVIGWSNWQPLNSGPPANEAVAMPESDPAICFTWGPGTYHFTYYDGPTSVAPVGYVANTGHVTWTLSTSDQGAIGEYRLELYELVGGSPVLIDSAHVFDPLATSYDFTTVLTSGHLYYVRVTPADAHGDGAGTDSFVDEFGAAAPNGDPKIDLSGSMLAQFRAGVTVLGVVSTDPAPL